MARVYKLVFTAIDSESAMRVVWMPAHTSEDAVGVLRLGDGTFLSATDRFGNSEADRLAKLAVEEHRVPATVRQAVQKHTELQRHLAMWLGQVTAAAGDWQGGGPTRDTAASRKMAREAAKARGGQKQTRARRIVTLRPAELGGHRLARNGPKWQCVVCKTSSKHWDRVAGKMCSGSVAKKWALKARELAASGSALGGGHTFLLSGCVVWCAECGAFTDDGSVKALAKPCSGGHSQAGRRVWDKSRN